MAVVVSGAVILEQKGKKIKYQRKCESCGTVQNRTVRTSVNKSVTKKSSFRCSKCRNKQEVILKG